MQPRRLEAFPSDIEDRMPTYSDFSSIEELTEDVIYTQSFHRIDGDLELDAAGFEALRAQLPPGDGGVTCLVVDGNMVITGPATIDFGLIVTGDLEADALTVSHYHYVVVGGTLRTDILVSLTSDGVPVVTRKGTTGRTRDIPFVYLSQEVHELKLLHGAYDLRKAEEHLRDPFRGKTGLAVLLDAYFGAPALGRPIAAVRETDAADREAARQDLLSAYARGLDGAEFEATLARLDSPAFDVDPDALKQAITRR